MAANAGALCYNRPMSEPSTPAPFGAAVLDGWALAAALDGGADATRACAPALAGALRERLGALAAPAQKVAALRSWSRRVRPAVGAELLGSVPPRARALLAPLASAEARSEAAASLRDLPSPRRGYRPPPGLAAGLAARASRRATTPTDADRGRGRRVLAGSLEDDAVVAFLAQAGPEADAVEQLAQLAGGATAEDPLVPFALAAARGHRDPVGRFGQLLASTDAGARELRELEAACRA